MLTSVTFYKLVVTKIDAMTCKIGLGAYNNDDADYESDLQKIFPEKTFI
jgi:hypothetical protein